MLHYLKFSIFFLKKKLGLAAIGYRFVSRVTSRYIHNYSDKNPVNHGLALGDFFRINTSNEILSVPTSLNVNPAPNNDLLGLRSLI